MKELEKFESRPPLKIKTRHIIIGVGIFLLVFKGTIKIIDFLIDSFI
jgi:hypothetical protein